MSTIARMTLEEYEKMPPLEIINGAEPRTELIRGELRIMNPIGVPHADVVDRLTEWSITTLPLKLVRVRIQQPLRMAAFESEPLPDVAWVARGSSSKRHPTPSDVLLIIEVADSSLTKDRGEKAELYADAGIEEYWIANIPEQCVEVMREPIAGKYQSMEAFGAGKSVQPLRFPQISLSVDAVFGRDDA